MNNRAAQILSLAVILLPLMGCQQWWWNGWFDPRQVGVFGKQKTMEIRTALTLEDTSATIPGAVYPTAEDLTFQALEYPISPGDQIAIEIYELRQRFVPYAIPQIVVSNTGFVNIPTLGRIKAEGFTVPEFEQEVTQVLQERDILVDPQVTVTPLFLQRSTYSVFGIGASGAVNAPLRAGTFPLRRPDTRVLEAINQVGGLNEAVIDIYVFRYDEIAQDGLPAEAVEQLDRASSDKAEHGAAENGAAEPGSQDSADLMGTDQDRFEKFEAALRDAAPQDAIEGGKENETGPAGQDADQDEVAKELIDAALGDAPATMESGDTPTDDEENGLEPDIQPPFLYQNDRWVVENPARRSNDQGPSPLAKIDNAAKLRAKTATVDWTRVSGETNYRVIRIPAAELRSGDPSFNIYVRAGDVIRIISGEIGFYWVMGQVLRVGPFTFNSEPITLKAAIAAAGGFTPDAWPSRVTVYRRIGRKEQIIPVDLDKIFAGEEPDFYIKRGDVINVGTHPLSPWVQRIRAGTLPNVGGNLSYSFSYGRNFADIDSFGAKANPANRPDTFPNLFP